MELRALALAALVTACGGAAAAPEPAAPEDAEPATTVESTALVTPVPALDGLGGTYVRLGLVPIGQLSRVTLTPISASGDGRYTRTLNRLCWPAPACAQESGTYHAVPENPAIGSAFLTLGTANYLIEGIRRDARGIAQLQLRLVANTVTAPFLMTRF